MCTLYTLYRNKAIYKILNGNFQMWKQSGSYRHHGCTEKQVLLNVLLNVLSRYLIQRKTKATVFKTKNQEYQAVQLRQLNSLNSKNRDLHNARKTE